MNGPGTDALRFGMACLLGVGLGLLYDFLRPLRPKRTGLADGIFLLAVVWGWVYLGFGVCGGDLRLGYAAGLPVGGLTWEWTLGRWLRPVFTGFWKGFRRILTLLCLPVKKFFKKTGRFSKKYLHLVKNGLQ